jgi:hypothetical protein
MAEFSGHGIDATELADDDRRLIHNQEVRALRTKVNVENVCRIRDGAREKRISPIGDIPVKVTEELRKLRQRAGLSMAEMAQLLGYKTASGYQRYESSDEYTKVLFPITFVHKLLQALEGRGDPPIGMADVIPLAGIAGGMTSEGLFEYAESLLPFSPSKAPLTTLDKLPSILTPESTEDGNRVALVLQTQIERIAVDRGYSPASFGIELSDNSMTCDKQSQHSFKKGDRIICDPRIAAQPSDFVIAIRREDKHAIFRRYRLAGYDLSGNQIIELVAVNSDYPTVEISAAHPGRIVARVMEHRRRL